MEREVLSAVIAFVGAPGVRSPERTVPITFDPGTGQYEARVPSPGGDDEWKGIVADLCRGGLTHREDYFFGEPIIVRSTVWLRIPADAIERLLAA